MPNREKQISPLAEAEIAELEKSGIHPTPDEIVWLDRLARQVETPTGPSYTARGIPVRVALTQVWLWPFTLAGKFWWREQRLALEGLADSDFDTYLLAYALAHGRICGHFDKLIEPRSIMHAVYDWVGTIAATDAELTHAINLILLQSHEIEGDPRDEEVSEKDMARLQDHLAQLQLHAGQSADYWAHEVCSDYAQHVIDVLAAQFASDDKPDINAPELRAQRALGAALADIKRSRKEAQDNG